MLAVKNPDFIATYHLINETVINYYGQVIYHREGSKVTLRSPLRTADILSYMRQGLKLDRVDTRFVLYCTDFGYNREWKVFDAALLKTLNFDKEELTLFLT